MAGLPVAAPQTSPGPRTLHAFDAHEPFRELVLRRDREIGGRHGLGYAGQLHYIGPEQNRVEEYIRQHDVPRG
jgi:hypothetical protein